MASRAPFPSGADLIGDVWKGEWYPAHCYKIPAITALNSILAQVGASPTGASIADPNVDLLSLKQCHEALGELAASAESAQKQVACFLQIVQQTALSLQKQAGRKVATMENTAPKFKKWFWKSKHGAGGGAGAGGAALFPTGGSGLRPVPGFGLGLDAEAQQMSSSSEDDAAGMPSSRLSRTLHLRSQSLHVPMSMPHLHHRPTSLEASERNPVRRTEGSGNVSARISESSPVVPRAKTEVHSSKSARCKDFSLSAFDFGRIMENLQEEDDDAGAHPMSGASSHPRTPSSEPSTLPTKQPRHDRERRSLGATDFEKLGRKTAAAVGTTVRSESPIFGVSGMRQATGVGGSAVGRAQKASRKERTSPGRGRFLGRTTSPGGRTISPGRLLGSGGSPGKSDSPRVKGQGASLLGSGGGMQISPGKCLGAAKVEPMTVSPPSAAGPGDSIFKVGEGGTHLLHALRLPEDVGVGNARLAFPSLGSTKEVDEEGLSPSSAKDDAGLGVTERVEDSETVRVCDDGGVKESAVGHLRGDSRRKADDGDKNVDGDDERVAVGWSGKSAKSNSDDGDSVSWSGKSSNEGRPRKCSDKSTSLAVDGASKGPLGSFLSRAKSARHPPASPMYSVSLQLSPATKQKGDTPESIVSAEVSTPHSGTAPVKMSRSLSRQAPAAAGMALDQQSPSSDMASLHASPLVPGAKKLTKSQTMQSTRGSPALHSPHHSQHQHVHARHKKSGHERLLEIMSNVQYTWASQSASVASTGSSQQQHSGASSPVSGVSGVSSSDGSSDKLNARLREGPWQGDDSPLEGARKLLRDGAAPGDPLGPAKARLHPARPPHSPAKKAQEEMLLELLKAAPPIKWSHVTKEGEEEGNSR